MGSEVLPRSVKVRLSSFYYLVNCVCFVDSKEPGSRGTGIIPDLFEYFPRS